ncbi:hypothetical protein ACQP2K_29770 [Microbispora siamensis]
MTKGWSPTGKALTTMAVAVAVTAAVAAGPPAWGAAPGASTADQKTTSAWRDGAFQVDTAAVVSRSDLVLEGPGWRDYQSMPLGNGHLGAAVWSQDGFTAQLNRNDTFPDLKSAGRLVVPGLFELAGAPDYRGRLNLADAVLEQSGRGMTARTFVRADRDQLVLEVTGAKPGKEQTADLDLWDGRNPTTYAEGGIGALAETFTDSASGRTTGAVAAITADARDVSTAVVDANTVRLTFKPRADGSYRIVVGVPSYTGGDVGKAGRQAVEGATQDRVDAAHLSWWHGFWKQWGDQVIEVKVRQIQVGASVMFRAPDRSNGYVWNIGGPLGSAGGLGQLRMSTVVNGRSTLIGSVVPIEPAAGNEYTLRIEAIGDRLRTFVDGKLVDDRTDGTFARGRVGFNLGGSDVGEYDSVKVSSPQGAVLFDDDFSGDLSKWEIPADRQDVPLVVFEKRMPAGRVVLGPNSGVSGRGDSSYLTFVGEPGE